LLDARLSKLNPPLTANRIVPVFRAGEAADLLVDTAEANDAVYVVAPETDGTLESLVQLLGKTGKIVLNCEASAISQVADKTLLYTALRSRGLPLPETLIFKGKDGPAEVSAAIKNRLVYPVIFKPADGVSCSGLSVVHGEAQIEEAISKAKAESLRKDFVVQKFIGGDPVSVSLLCTSAKATPLSLNQQDIDLSAPEKCSSYLGGVVPLDHPAKRKAFATAEKVAASFHGLRGYVGVDMVLSEGEPYVVDVNPRLTTSYVGLSRVAGFNVAKAMANAVLKGELPKRHENREFAVFKKVESAKLTAKAFQKATHVNGVVSPPFPLDACRNAISLVDGFGETLEKAQLAFEENKKRLLNIIGGRNS
jgi:hypothetical protein